MGIVARAAVPADMERMVSLLDQQFVFGKGRRTSLAQCFPATYCAANAGNSFLLEERGELLSCHAGKRFDLVREAARWQGLMIGAVYTRPERRGEGLASRLFEESAENLRQAGIDFAVLWTDQPAFYARLGWHLADKGVLGECENRSSSAESGNKVSRTPAYAGDFAYLERIRRRWCGSLTMRQADDYRQLPPPATAVELLTCGEGVEHATYALVGNDGVTGILYELIGHPDGFPTLWAEVCRGYKRMLVNDDNGSVSHRWLAQNTGLVWREKPLAMWLPLSTKMEIARVTDWYVPYFDRI